MAILSILNKEPGNNIKIEPELFQLLAHFQYGFPTNDQTGWVLPDLMPASSDITIALEKTAYFTRVFQYEQPIQNIHYQIFAQFFTSLKPGSLSQNGAVIIRGKAQVAVIIDKTTRTISLLIEGPGSGALRQEIEAKIEETNSVEQLTAIKNVPCICPQCLSDKKPKLYTYNDLINFQSKAEIIQCSKSKEIFNLKDLLALEPTKIRIQTLIETFTKISNADEKRMLELLEGKDDSARMAWLEKGLAAYRAVGQVIGSDSAIGTGFILADSTVLTCNHVVKKEDLEKGATIKFTALEQPDQIFTYNLALEGFECSPSEALNFSKIQVHDLEGKPLSSWGHLPSFNINPVKIGAPVFMIRYHQGKIKEIDFKPSVVIDASTDFIYYTFHESSAGSSGGPIFNENWDCVGMHEAAGERLDIGTSGRKGPARKGVSIKAILKPTTDEQQPEGKVSQVRANAIQRIIFGLKIRQLRQDLGWNFEELSRQCNISISYLHEIEKGKKYPQPKNLQKLAEALGTTPEFLTSLELTKQIDPLGDLLKTTFPNEIPQSSKQNQPDLKHPNVDEQLDETEQIPIITEIEFIQDLVAQDDLDGALKALTTLDEKFQIGIRNDIILLSGNIKRTQKEYDGELLTNEDYRRMQAQNTYRLLALLNEIPQKLEKNQAAQNRPTDIRRKIKK